ncbi:7TM GPCR, serpentine receptor class e (Sre) family-containing protein [Strongyloides ratti]|uniref:7TM GPCR, serpentine receptor class e (Sre) family-containing protein n=1 Tax=Strongyloides ratti TaxID=34506 RepID=A0A090LJI0_STRRB|nr:7TM GPCR, serpentine receptor class e (Sre) family-containing protein [Strongyloides ratti]CEF69992.1 7TM GPCR, serpentine receptor class e (Sre) family-containing protein [Strongyloides ratti]
MVIFVLLHFIKNLLTIIQGLVSYYEQNMKLYWSLLTTNDIDKIYLYISNIRISVNINIREIIGLIIIERFFATKNRKKYQNIKNIKELVILTIILLTISIILPIFIDTDINGKLSYAITFLIVLDLIYIISYFFIVRRNIKLLSMKKSITKTLDEKFQIRENIHIAKAIFPIMIISIFIQFVSNIILLLLFYFIKSIELTGITTIIYLCRDFLIATSYIYFLIIKSYFDNNIFQNKITQQIDKNQVQKSKVLPTENNVMENGIKFDIIKKNNVVHSLKSNTYFEIFTKDW